jgi:hypothetical protein
MLLEIEVYNYSSLFDSDENPLETKEPIWIEIGPFYNIKEDSYIQ